MRGISSRRLADLLGDLAGDRFPRDAALAGRIRLLTADGRLPVASGCPPSVTSPPPPASAAPP